MKNAKMLWGIVALMVLFALFVAGCDTPAGGTDSGSSSDNGNKGGTTYDYTFTNASTHSVRVQFGDTTFILNPGTSKTVQSSNKEPGDWSLRTLDGAKVQFYKNGYVFTITNS
jgi:hypothetical protein